MPILLSQLIENYKGLMADSTPPALIERLMQEMNARRQTPWFSSIVRSGRRAPDISLKINGAEPTTLSSLLADGPVLLKFYRGRWCPFCTLELKAYERLAPALLREGVRLIAVTGESEQEIALTRQHDCLSFDIAHDANLAVAKQFQLTYDLGPAETSLYQRHSCAGNSSNGCAAMSLALPALYLIEPDGQISFASVSVDPSIRAEPADVLSFIRQRQTH